MNKQKFPNVNFIGNKRKLSGEIVSSTPVRSGTVLDLFAGGTSVSYGYKLAGYKVISNDSMYASYVLNKALIENPGVVISEEIIAEALNYDLSSNDRERFNWLENNLYYPEEVDELSKLVIYSEKIESYSRYLFQSLIRRAMIRKLPYSRMNINWDNIKKLRDEDYSYSKYGRRRAYQNEKFSTHILKNLESYNQSVFDNGQKNISVQMDALRAVEKFKGVDILYLDPPYPGTMNNYDGFYGAFDRVFNRQINYSDWTKSENFIINLRKVLEKAYANKTKNLLLSINTRSKPDYMEIVDLFENFGKVTVKNKKHNYQVSGKENKNKNSELLIILEFNL